MEGQNNEEHSFDNKSMYSYVSFRPNGIAVSFRCKVRMVSNAANATPDMLFDVLHEPAYPEFSFTGSAVTDLKPTIKKPVHATLNGVLFIAGKKVAANVPITVTTNGKEYDYKANLSTNLTALGIKIPAHYSGLNGNLRVTFTNKEL